MQTTKTIVLSDEYKCLPQIDLATTSDPGPRTAFLDADLELDTLIFLFESPQDYAALHVMRPPVEPQADTRSPLLSDMSDVIVFNWDCAA